MNVGTFAKDGIQVKARARVTVRSNLERYVGSAQEETIVARVGERGGAAILLYQLDKARGEIGRDECTQLKQLRLVALQALHPLPLEQPCARRFAGTCHGSGG